MTRRCSHCSNNGHNSRTCPTRATTAGGGSSGGGGGGGVKLFGVRLTDGSFMKKSASMGNLSHYYNNPGSSTSAATSPGLDQPGSPPVHDPVRDGYLSDDPTHHVSCSSSNRRGERKKGKPWTEEEHRLFLIGLQKLGKGDWRGIARSYVVSRTPTQVASHAQKYFIRQSNATRRKRRSSLFDMVPDMVTEEPENVPDEQSVPAQPEPRETDNSNALPSLDLSLGTESEPMEATSTEEVKETQENQPLPNNIPLPPIPAFFVPLPYPPIWQQSSYPSEENTKSESVHHQVLKPTPVHLKEPVDVDHLMGMSQLNLSEAENGLPAQPQVQLSLNILGGPSRQSAFHASAPSSSSELKEGKSSVIPAA